MKNFRIAMLFCAALPLEVACADVHLDQVELPLGFSIEIYAEDVENARQMVLGDNGTLFAGSRKAGKLWAMTDADGALLVSDDLAGVIYRISYTQ